MTKVAKGYSGIQKNLLSTPAAEGVVSAAGNPSTGQRQRGATSVGRRWPPAVQMGTAAAAIRAGSLIWRTLGKL
jgi:hypothetical protein